MLAFILMVLAFTRVLIAAIKDPPFRALTVAVVAILAVGTTFYRLVEGWGVLDSVYFSVTTLTTVGYGDFAPDTAAGKVFTIFYLFLGLGVIAAFATTIVQRSRIWVRLAQGDAAAGQRKEDTEA